MEENSTEPHCGHTIGMCGTKLKWCSRNSMVVQWLDSVFTVEVQVRFWLKLDHKHHDMSKKTKNRQTNKQWCKTTHLKQPLLSMSIQGSHVCSVLIDLLITDLFSNCSAVWATCWRLEQEWGRGFTVGGRDHFLWRILWARGYQWEVWESRPRWRCCWVWVTCVWLRIHTL